MLLAFQGLFALALTQMLTGVRSMQVSAPRLLEALTADMPAEVAALRHVFAAFAAFGAGRGQRAGEMDGVGAAGSAAAAGLQC
jgi:hypothetical protein